MNRPDGNRRLGPIATLFVALAGVAGGLVLALYSFVQLRTAWLDGVFAFGDPTRTRIDLDYESEPLSYIVAMSALYPTAIVVGGGLAIVCAVIAYKQLTGRSRTRRCAFHSTRDMRSRRRALPAPLALASSDSYLRPTDPAMRGSSRCRSRRTPCLIAGSCAAR